MRSILDWVGGGMGRSLLCALRSALVCFLPGGGCESVCLHTNHLWRYCVLCANRVQVGDRD